MDALASYVRDQERLGRASAVTARYHAAHIGRALGRLPVGLVNEEAVARYVSGRRQSGVRDATILRELATLSAALRAVGGPSVRRAARAVRGHVPRRRERRLTRAEAARLVDACEEPHLRLAVQILLGTGLRVGRVLALTWDEVDLDRRQLLLGSAPRRSKGYPPVLPLTASLTEALRASWTGDSGPVVSWQGRSVSAIRGAFNRARNRAGLGADVTLHVLRHSVATWLLDDGVPLTVVSQLLGHSSVTVTERVYARHTAQALSLATERLEQVAFAGSFEPPARTAPERSGTGRATVAPKIGGKLDRGALHTVGVAGSIPAAPTIARRRTPRKL